MVEIANVVLIGRKGRLKGKLKINGYPSNGWPGSFRRVALNGITQNIKVIGNVNERDNRGDEDKRDVSRNRRINAASHSHTLICACR